MKNFYLVLLANVILIAFFIFKSVITPNFGSDYFLQHAGSLNIIDSGEFFLLDNDGICEDEKVMKLTSFPIGYSILTLPLVKFVKYPQHVHTILYILSLIALAICIYLISKRLFESGTYSLLAVFISIFFGLKGHTVDLAAFTILLFGIYGLSVSFSKSNPLKFSLSLLLIVITCTVRFAYYPQLIFILVAFIFVFIRSSHKREKIHYFIGLLVPSIFLGLYALWWLNFSGEVNRLETVANGSHWNFENILHFRPLFLDYFLDTYRLYSFLGIESYDYDRGFDIPIIVRITTLLLSTILFVISTVYLYRKSKSTSNSFQKHFLLFIVTASVINILFIYFLSFYYESVSSEYIWTWAMLPRYFIINFFAFSIFLIYVIRESNPRIKYITYFILISGVLVNTADHIRLQVKVYSLNNKENTDIKYPGYHLNDLNDFYVNYIEHRGEYCIILDKKNNFTSRQIQWIKIYGQLLFFPTYVEELTNKEQYSSFTIGQEQVYLERKTNGD